jgi:hypothetical protein
MDAESLSSFGFVFTGIVAVGGWFWQRHQEKVSIQTALRAEVFALTEIARKRRYMEGLMESANELETNRSIQGHSVSMQIAIPLHYSRVYAGNVSKIGYLNVRNAESVVRFYQYVDSVVQDVSPGGILYEGSCDPEDFRETASILQQAFDISDALRQTPPRRFS